MSNVPNRETFESIYAGKAPWNIGGPQPEFVKVADRLTGAVLDAGCGTGENALFFAGRGHPVLGIDSTHAPVTGLGLLPVLGHKRLGLDAIAAFRQIAQLLIEPHQRIDNLPVQQTKTSQSRRWYRHR